MLFVQVAKLVYMLGFRGVVSPDAVPDRLREFAFDAVDCLHGGWVADADFIGRDT